MRNRAARTVYCAYNYSCNAISTFTAAATPPTTSTTPTPTPHSYCYSSYYYYCYCYSYCYYHHYHHYYQYDCFILPASPHLAPRLTADCHAWMGMLLELSRSWALANKMGRFETGPDYVIPLKTLEPCPVNPRCPQGG